MLISLPESQWIALEMLPLMCADNGIRVYKKTRTPKLKYTKLND